MTDELIEQRPTDGELRMMSTSQLAEATMHALERSKNDPRPVERARWRQTYEAAKAIGDGRHRHDQRRRMRRALGGF